MKKTSAGLLFYHFKNQALQVLLVHPGGPYWKNKDLGSWSIPKGEIGEDEDFLQAAIRETAEEIGIHIEVRDPVLLKPAQQKSGKIVYAFAYETSFELTEIKSNYFEMEWPPKSGKKKLFPEVDKALWFTLEEAQKKIVGGQLPLLMDLKEKISKGEKAEDA